MMIWYFRITRCLYNPVVRSTSSKGSENPGRFRWIDLNSRAWKKWQQLKRLPDSDSSFLPSLILPSTSMLSIPFYYTHCLSHTGLSLPLVDHPYIEYICPLYEVSVAIRAPFQPSMSLSIACHYVHPSLRHPPL